MQFVSLWSLSFAAVLSLSLAPGCADVGEVGDEDRLTWAMLESVANHAYRGDGFVKVNTESFPTELNDTEQVNVYVSRDAAAAFWAIDPDVDGSGTELPVGAAIVREVIGGGEVNKLTVMVHGADGYFLDGGDFCYGVTDPSGVRFADDDHGEPLRGRIATCASCHVDRAGDGFLFGVRERYRAPAPM